jgi:dienelactone hydrolase
MERLILLDSECLLTVYLLVNAAIVIALGVMTVLIGEGARSGSASAAGRRRRLSGSASPAWLAAARAHPAGRWLVVLGVFALLAGPAAADPGTEAPKTRVVRDTFLSAKKSITVERFEPAAAGMHPAIVLLHAVEGLEKPFGEQYRAAAQRFAERGYVVVLLHYFERTGTDPKTVKAVSETFLKFARGEDLTGQERQTIREKFDAWAETVRDAVAYTRKLPSVDDKRVGLVGFSVGAYLSLAVAAQEDLQLAAVVELFGALPDGMEANLKRLPPTLIIHGDNDPVVNVQKARNLHKVLAARKVPDEVQIYKGVGHVFLDDDGAVTFKAMSAALDAETRASAFLEKYLKNQAAARRGK